MSEGKRSRLSLTQRSEIWGRWKAGQSLHEIGRAFGKPHSCIRCLLLPRGGIAPALRRRSRLALSRAEREDISRGIACGSPLREIARHLDRAASTVSREVPRHGGRPAYRAHEADDQAWESALRPKKCLLAVHQRLREVVASKLILDWSPEQISGWLKTQYPDDESMRVSHETVYRSLFIQARVVGPFDPLPEDLEGRIYEANETFLRMVGYSRGGDLAGGPPELAEPHAAGVARRRRKVPARRPGKPDACRRSRKNTSATTAAGCPSCSVP
jgi:transposase, IS30 family